MGNIFTSVFSVLAVMNLIFFGIIVFNQRRNPTTTWAWLMVVILIPYAGFFIYMLLGSDARKHTTFALKAKLDEGTYNKYVDMDSGAISFLNKQIEYIKSENMLQFRDAGHFDDMMYLNLISGNGAYSENNEIDIYNEGNSKFEALLKDIKKARHYIHMEYYIVRNDDLAKRIVAALAKKAAAGVEVRILIDGMGCVMTPKKLFRPIQDAGGHLGIFLPPQFIRINYRNHRKIAVIDGKTGYIGGLNIGDEYLGKSKRFGNWRDCHLRIKGDSVKQLELRFMMDWNYASEHKIEMNQSYFPEIKKTNTKTGVQIVSSGPDTKWPVILYSYTKMITEADKTIYIQTPYFVPDDSLLAALRVAGLSGIDVRIMIPAHPDHPFVYSAALSYLGDLLEAGVKCYQYEAGFVHSKCIIVDSIVSSVGTANVDIRSFKLNFEINAFIYGEQAAKKLEADFLNDLQHCTEITLEWYNDRSYKEKIKESLSRLLSPIL